jgi:copper oxidase (laccase) domain-containing protein
LDNITPGLKQLASVAPSARSQQYVANRTATVDNLSMLQQHILLQDQIHGTDLKTVDPDLYQVIFL